MTGAAGRLVLAVVLLLPGCWRTASRPVPTAAPLSAPTAAPQSTPTAAPQPVQAAAEPAAETDYVFPIRGCAARYGRTHHDYPATDIVAAVGCAFVAPVAGRIDEVEQQDRWRAATDRGADRGGLSVSLIGRDGVRYYGSHLMAIGAGIRPGVSVSAGRLLGQVGRTGNARGTSAHLHLGISWPTGPGNWQVRRGRVFPWPYLDAWRAGRNRSPALAVRRARASAG